VAQLGRARLTGGQQVAGSNPATRIQSLIIKEKRNCLKRERGIAEQLLNFTGVPLAMMQCELCDRDLERLTVHHLVPKQSTKRKKENPGPTANICSACHRQIHALFDNKYLAKELNTIEKLKQEPQMQKFLSWVKKQDPGKRVTVHRQK
jgi:5-methylcytosine-specific restriction endonuclease McrA